MNLPEPPVQVPNDLYTFLISVYSYLNDTEKVFDSYTNKITILEDKVSLLQSTIDKLKETK